jgi:tRNA dimethylallyltransferase
LPARRYLLPHVVQIGLAIDRAALDARIAARVDAMWAAGFVDEVRQLAAEGLRESLTASRALGYRQVLRFLDGEISEAEARELTVAATRKFARRQDSWFRKDTRISWLPYDHPELVSDAYALGGPTGVQCTLSNPDPSWKTDPHAAVVVREGTRHPQRLRRPSRS